MEWFYIQNGKKIGPISHDVLIQLARAGQIMRDDMVWNSGLDEWVEAREVRLPGDSPLFDEPPPLPPSRAISSVPTRRPHRRWAREEDASSVDSKDTAQTAMILSIVGLFIFGFLGIIGMILGFQAMSQMNRSGTQSGHGMALAGIVIGIIDVIGWFLILLMWNG